MYLLDSSAVIEILQGTDKASAIKKIIHGYFVTSTSLSLHEVAIGEDLDNLNNVFDFFDSIEVIPFDKNSAMFSFAIEKELRKEGKLINKMDILIASVCQQHNLTLITLDKDFNKIKSIKAIIID